MRTLPDPDRPTNDGTSRLAGWIVDAAAAVLSDPRTRDRYREQWHADVDGASGLGLSRLRIACGLPVAAVRLALVESRRSTTDPAPSRPVRVRHLLPALDFGMAALGGGVSIALSDHPWLGFTGGFDPHPPLMYVSALVLLPLVWVTVLAVCGAYRSRQSVRGEFRRVVTGIVAVLAVVSSALLATAFPASRGAVVLALSTAATGVLCGRTACRVGGWYGRIRPARR